MTQRLGWRTLHIPILSSLWSNHAPFAAVWGLVS